MNYVKVKPKRRKTHDDFLFPQLGNILNELMRTSVSDLANTDVKKERHTVPAVNVIEQKDRFLLEMAIPGLKKSEVEIKVEDDQLVISSSINKEDPENTKWRVREFNYGQFRRQFALSEDVDQSRISAKFENGILYIHLMKREDKVDRGPFKINIS